MSEVAGEGARGRLAGWSGSSLLLLASLLFSGALAEVGTRLLSKNGPSLLVMDAVRGKHWLDGYDGEVFVPEAERALRLRFHRDGFRGPERPHQKPPATRRLVVLGDSMIAAVAVDEPQTLVGQLDAGLNEPSAAGGAAESERFEVLNFGVSSASTGQELVTYRQVARLYQPDTVVVAFNTANDLADNCSCLSRANRLYFDLDPHGGLVERRFSPPAAELSRWLDRHSRFYVWQKEAFARLRAMLRARQGRLEPGAEIFRTEGEARIETAWRITAALLAALAAEVKADGARPMLLLVPAPEEVYDDLWRALQRRAGDQAGRLDRANPARRLGAIASQLGVPFLELGPALRTATPQRLSTVAAEQVFFGGRYHLNERGNRIAAEAVRRWLGPLAAPPDPGPSSR